MAQWKKGRQGEELSEVLRNSTEPDGHNNGKDHVDDAGTAHALIAAREEALHGEHAERRKPGWRWNSRDYADYALAVAKEPRPWLPDTSQL
jgi:hypothetical protein